MKKPKSYKILSGLPASGPMFINISEVERKHYQEGFVVRFFKDDGSNWIANFENGWTGFCGIFDLFNGNCLVIANGAGYIINPNSEIPLTMFGVGFKRIIKAGKNKYILQDQTDVTVVNKDGSYWNSERISWDGLKSLKLEGNLLKGLAYNPMGDEWSEFTIDIDTRILKGGSYQIYESIKEPWWKFW